MKAIVRNPGMSIMPIASTVPETENGHAAHRIFTLLSSSKVSLEFVPTGVNICVVSGSGMSGTTEFDIKCRSVPVNS